MPLNKVTKQNPKTVDKNEIKNDFIQKHYSMWYSQTWTCNLFVKLLASSGSHCTKWADEQHRQAGFESRLLPDLPLPFIPTLIGLRPWEEVLLTLCQVVSGGRQRQISVFSNMRHATWFLLEVETTFFFFNVKPFSFVRYIDVRTGRNLSTILWKTFCFFQNMLFILGSLN